MAGALRFMAIDRSADASIITSSPVEDSDFPQTNLVGAAGRDRFSLWRTPSPPGADPVLVDIQYDAGAASTGFIGICGLRHESSSDFLGALTVTVYHATSSAYSSPTSVGTASLLSDMRERDWGFVFTAVSKEFWRVAFTSITGYFSVGRVVLGTLATFGGPSPGGLSVAGMVGGGALVGPGGHQHEFEGRDETEVISVSARGITSAQVAVLNTARKFGPGQVMFDLEDKMRQVRFPKGARPTIRTRWNDTVTKVYDADFTLERIP